MCKIFLLIFHVFLFTHSFAQDQYNFKITLNDIDEVVLCSASIFSEKITIKKDTLMFINAANNNLFYLQKDKERHYLFIENNSMIDIKFSNNNTFYTKGEHANFIIFLNEYYDIYNSRINKLLSRKFTSDKFEIELYKLLNDEVFKFYSNHKLFSSFNSSVKNYFKDLLKYTYLNCLTEHLMTQKRDTVQAFPFYTDININLLDWNMLKNNMLDTTYSNLNIYQNYVFNGSILFALNNYKYFDRNNFQLFNNYLFEFILENLSSNLLFDFFNNYMQKFSKFLNQKTITYLENCLMNTDLEKSDIYTLLNYYNSDFKEKNINETKEDILEYKFYLEDINSNQISLSDFEGKILYLDIWASWCGPCRKQFPYAQELKSKLSKRQLKKIKFIYISIDNNYDKWKESLKKLNIDGYHFISPSNKSNSAGAYFEVSSIPRYLIIDTNGEIINNNAKRPSDDTLLQELLDLIN